MLKLLTMSVGPIGTNCYVAYNDENNIGVIIDPGGSAEGILKNVAAKEIKVAAIFLTHGHFDHIGGVEEVRQALQVPVYISAADAPMLEDPMLNLSEMMGVPMVTKPAEQLYKDGDSIELGGLTYTIQETPGHTPGGVCILCEDMVFCGDTLISETVGRTDLPNGSYTQLMQSIKRTILPLPADTTLCPGHGPITTVDWEKRRNSFLQGIGLDD